MSVAYFIVLDKEVDFDTMVNGKFLAKESNRIEKIASTLGMKAFDDYVSQSPDEARAMMEEAGVDPDELEDIVLPEQQWFDAQEGVDLVSKISTHVRANPSSVKNAKGVLADLEEYEEILQKAKSAGAKWNLQIDF